MDGKQQKRESFWLHLREATRMHNAGDLAAAEVALEDLLSEAAVADRPEASSDHVADLSPLCEIHLRLAKVRRSLGRVREAVSSCNSALEARNGVGANEVSLSWREPFLYRSACMRAVHQELKADDGEESDDVARDRREAHIVVDPGLEEERRERDEDGKLALRRLDEALSAARDGETIFVERGRYRVASDDSSVGAPFFVFGKSVSVVGASAGGCVLEYRSAGGKGGRAAAGKLDTFLICGGGGGTTLLKRLTFRAVGNSDGEEDGSGKARRSAIGTRFLGVAAGRVHLEDCIFDGGGDAVAPADAVYASSRICGPLASDYPMPVVTARFCVFDHCRSFAAFTAMTAEAHLRCCLFVGSRLSALSHASVTAEDCDFVQSFSGGGSDASALLSATSSNLYVRRCYVQGDVAAAEVEEGNSSTDNGQAVALTSDSYGLVADSYVCSTGNGVACSGSDLECVGNVVVDCSRRRRRAQGLAEEVTSLLGEMKLEEGDLDTTPGMCTAVSVRSPPGANARRKVVVSGNLIFRCDVGVHAGKDSFPVVRSNRVVASTFTGVFAECGAKPTVVDNAFLAKSDSCGGGPSSSGGLGVLMVLGACGLVGKNRFVGHRLSPVMVFGSCRPLVTGNAFQDVLLDSCKQERMEDRMRSAFRQELFSGGSDGDDGNSHFYIVDGEESQKDLKDLILNGNPQ